jgi:hypothetical protein
MTEGGFPAPGSSAPGAPPPLRRALTPADGVTDAAPVPAAAPTAAVGAPVSVPARRLTAAAAMVGIAVGLEIAAVLPHITAARQRSKTTGR